MRNHNHNKLISKLALLTVGMFGFGYALVPLYSIFCDITGLNGRVENVAAVVTSTDIDKSREVTIEFTGGTNDNMPWEFRPLVSKMHVYPGEPNKLLFYAKNTADHTIIGNAVPSVSPGTAAKYFVKTECFCFTQQKLEAGESREMPVVFIVDKDLPKNVTTITLSYTFFNSPATAQLKPEHSLANRLGK